MGGVQYAGAQAGGRPLLVQPANRRRWPEGRAASEGRSTSHDRAVHGGS